MSDTQPTPKPTRTGKPTGNNRGLAQAYDIRDLAATEVLRLASLTPDTLQDSCTRAQAIASLARVWESASDRVRIIRGRPLPGSKRPAPDQPKRGPMSRPVPMPTPSASLEPGAGSKSA